MNKTELEILEILRDKIIHSTKKDALIYYRALKQKFKSKYSYYFYIFLNETEEQQMLYSKKIEANEYEFTMREIRIILHSRLKYKDNFHMFKINVLDKLRQDFDITVSREGLSTNKVQSVRITIN